MSCHNDWSLLKVEPKAVPGLSSPDDQARRWACLWACKDCGLQVLTHSVVTDTLVTPQPNDAEVELARQAEVDEVHRL